MELHRLVPSQRARDLSVDEMIAIRSQVEEEVKGEVWNHEEIRLLAFERTLKTVGCPDRDLAYQVNTVYLRGGTAQRDRHPLGIVRSHQDRAVNPERSGRRIHRGGHHRSRLRSPRAPARQDSPAAPPAPPEHVRGLPRRLLRPDVQHLPDSRIDRGCPATRGVCRAERAGGNRRGGCLAEELGIRKGSLREQVQADDREGSGLRPI